MGKQKTKVGPQRKKKKKKNQHKNKLPVLFYTARRNPDHPPQW